MDINQVREKYPQYNDLTDAQLLNGLHKKHYSDIPKEEFLAKFTTSKKVEPVDKSSYLGQQYIEPALNMASGAVAPIIAGASSALYAPFTGMEGAAEIYQDTRDRLTYKPRLEESQDNIGAINKYAGNVMQSLENSYQGQIASPVIRGGLNKLNQLADSAAENYGPGAGAAVKTIPTAIAEIALLKGAGAMRPSVKLLDDGQPTKQLETIANKQGMAVENFTPETQALVPTEVNAGLIGSADRNAKRLGKEMQVSQLQSGGRDAGLARFQIENGKTVKNKLGVDAINNGWEEGTVRMVDTMNPETKKIGKKMLNMRWALKQNETNASRKNPLIPVGQELSNRISFIRTEATKARNDLSRLVESPMFARKQVNARPVVRALKDSLDNLGIKYNRTNTGLQLNFKDSVIEFNPEAQGVIMQTLQMMRPDRKTTAKSMHLLKRQLDDMIDFKKKSKEGLSEQGRNVLKTLRHKVNEALKDSVDGYGEINGKLSAILTTMDDFKNAFKIDLNMYTDPSGAIGNEMRKIHSRYKAGELIDNNILDVDELAKNLGYKGDVAYGDLVSLANQLDRRFGSSKSRDIVGVNQSAQRAERFATDAATGNKPGIVREGFTMAAEGVNKIRGKDPEFDAYISLKELLNR